MWQRAGGQPNVQGVRCQRPEGPATEPGDTGGQPPAKGRRPGSPLLLGTQRRGQGSRPGLHTDITEQYDAHAPPHDAVAVTLASGWRGDFSGQGGRFQNAAEPEAAGPASLT